MGEKQDLKDALEMKEVEGNTAYHASYTCKAPGDHIFYIEPAPYWESAEEVMIAGHDPDQP